MDGSAPGFGGRLSGMPFREDAKVWGKRWALRLYRALNVIGTVDAVRSLPVTLRWIAGGAALLGAATAAVSAAALSLPLYAVIVWGLGALCLCLVVLALAIEIVTILRERKRGSVHAALATPQVDPQQLERLIRRAWWSAPEMRARLLAVRGGHEITLDDTILEMERQGAIKIIGRRPDPRHYFLGEQRLAACELTGQAAEIVEALIREAAGGSWAIEANPPLVPVTPGPLQPSR